MWEQTFSVSRGIEYMFLCEMSALAIIYYIWIELRDKYWNKENWEEKKGKAFVDLVTSHQKIIIQGKKINFFFCKSKLTYLIKQGQYTKNHQYIGEHKGKQGI